MILKNLVKVMLIFFLFLNHYAYAQHTNAGSDSSIVAQVKDKINSERLLEGTHIDVTTSDSIVNLSGHVDSDTQYSMATELAQSVPGVKDVNSSRLTVKESRQPLSDTLITAKIKGLFLQNKLFGNADVAAMSIKVETNNGVVTLTGTADNPEQAENAVKIAKSVSGVKRVKSSIKVGTGNSSIKVRSGTSSIKVRTGNS